MMLFKKEAELSQPDPFTQLPFQSGERQENAGLIAPSCEHGCHCSLLTSTKAKAGSSTAMVPFRKQSFAPGRCCGHLEHPWGMLQSSHLFLPWARKPLAKLRKGNCFILSLMSHEVVVSWSSVQLESQEMEDTMSSAQGSSNEARFSNSTRHPCMSDRCWNGLPERSSCRVGIQGLTPYHAQSSAPFLWQQTSVYRP